MIAGIRHGNLMRPQIIRDRPVRFEPHVLPIIRGLLRPCTLLDLVVRHITKIDGSRRKFLRQRPNELFAIFAGSGYDSGNIDYGVCAGFLVAFDDSLVYCLGVFVWRGSMHCFWAWNKMQWRW